jgi:hypothetical protein
MRVLLQLQLVKFSVIKQIEYIKTLQQTLPDCEIIDFISELKISKEALEFASKKAKEQG